ncbi:MAG: hypothetical protein IKT17_10215, partial [Lachnospiraceae bacterium]|nr:hypothetical protein [Lachnospiraceae bacterium]
MGQIIYICSNCNKVYRIGGTGKKAKCPNCTDTFLLDTGMDEDIWKITSKDEREEIKKTVLEEVKAAKEQAEAEAKAAKEAVEAKADYNPLFDIGDSEPADEGVQTDTAANTEDDNVSVPEPSSEPSFEPSSEPLSEPSSVPEPEPEPQQQRISRGFFGDDGWGTDTASKEPVSTSSAVPAAAASAAAQTGEASDITPAEGAAAGE